MKRALAVIALLAAVAIALYLVRGPRSFSRTSGVDEVSVSPANKKDFTPKARETPHAGGTPLGIVAVEMKNVPAASKRPSRYRVIGDGGYPAKVVDDAGNVLIEATPDFGIYGVAESPDGKRLLVKHYPVSLVLDVISGAKVALPAQPPGEHKLGFGSWDWVDDYTLLGVSGDKRTGPKTGVDGEGNNVAQTRLYSYDLRDRSLQEVKLDGIAAAVFSIAEMRVGGLVRLVQDDAAGDGDLGWFQVAGK